MLGNGFTSYSLIQIPVFLRIASVTLIALIACKFIPAKKTSNNYLQFIVPTLAVLFFAVHLCTHLICTPSGGVHVGVYGNVVWNTANGDFYMSDWFTNILGYHMLIISPFIYLPAIIFSNPFAFTIMHLLFVALGGIAIERLMFKISNNIRLSATAGIIYFFNPYIISWFNNSFTVYSPIFVLLPLTFFYAESNKKNLAGLLALSTALLLEDIAIGLALFWTAELFFRKKKFLPVWFGPAVILILSVYYFFIKPHLINVSSESQHLIEFLKFGFIGDVSSKIKFLLHLIVGTAGLCLFSPVFLLIGLPDVILAILSPTLEVHLVESPYLPALASSMMIAAVYGMKKVSELLPQTLSEKIPSFMNLFVILLSVAAYTNFVFSINNITACNEYNYERPFALDFIPVGATVATNDQTFYGWAIDRRCILLDKVWFSWLADVSEKKAPNCEWILLNSSKNNSGREVLMNLISSGRFQIVSSKGDIFIARRNQ